MRGFRNFILSSSVMASCSKRMRVEDSDSEDDETLIGTIEDKTGGLDSGEESELDHLLENESNISR